MTERRLGDYQLTEPLGSGSSGEVWEATKQGRRYAIKIWRDTRRVQRARDVVEALRGERWGIAQIHELVLGESGQIGMVMELVAGDTLAMRLRTGSLPLFEAACLTAALVRIVVQHIPRSTPHLQLNPHKVILRDEGPVLIGLGTSAMHDEEHLHGNPLYLAPEQIMVGAGDWRSDLYTVGMLGYEMVAGRPPYISHAISDLIESKLASPPRLRTIMPAVPEILDDLLHSMLEPDPDRRCTVELGGAWDAIIRTLRP